MSIGEGPETASIELDPGQLEAWMGREPDLQVVDVREAYEHEAGHIAGTLHVPLSQLPGIAQTLDRERPLVFYCRVGSRSELAAQAMRMAGFESYSMTGGLLRWADEGRPLAPPDGSVADH
jgi:rhodanese-related sulfurtransferase